ncbi:Nif11-like leader peptide family natural product precursor [Bradyrhizobium japonicum]|nr:Nif11-like leader peptide family natural product precursor [Bradyrhizobium japonicum]
MSQAEVERFVKNLTKEGSLLENLKQSATGLAPIVAVGRSHGYDFTVDEIRSSIRAPGRHELMQVDAIVGGRYSATIWVGRARRSGWRVSVAAR